MEIRLFKSLNHEEGNLKMQLLIKGGYYIVPDPSTALIYRVAVQCNGWCFLLQLTQINNFIHSCHVTLIPLPYKKEMVSTMLKLLGGQLLAWLESDMIV